MALVPTVTGVTTFPDQAGTRRHVLGTFAFDNLYQTNGMSILNSQIGLDTTNFMFVYPSAGYVFEYIASTKKVKAYDVAAIAGNTAAAPLAEVPVNTNLAALTLVSFEAWGV